MTFRHLWHWSRVLTSSEESPHVVVDVAVVVACLTRSWGNKDGARSREVVAAQFYLLDFHLKFKDWIGKEDSKESWISSKNPICLTYSYFTSYHYHISTTLPGMWGETVRPHGSELGEKGHKFDMISTTVVWLIFLLILLQIITKTHFLKGFHSQR